MKKEMEFINTDQAPEAIGPYSQAICTGEVIYASGQIPIDPATGKISGETIEDQTEQICRNIGAILKEAGSSFESVVKTTCYIENMGEFAAFNQVYGKYFISKPARACVAVKTLPKNVKAEIEVIALRG